MIRCDCCRAEIPDPVIRTVAGDFLPGWGLCRGCWRLVGKSMRAAIRRVRIAFQAAPHLEESVAFYRLWGIAVREATGRRAARRVA